MKRALLIIDYTDDFIADEGALTVGKPGQDLHAYILGLAEGFYGAGDYLAFMVDEHEPDDPYHPETQLFPPHNLAGKPGQEMYGDLQKFYESIQDSPQTLHRMKTRYSAFAGTDLFIKLRERQINELHLVGVSTEICILHTAIDAFNLGFKVYIHQEGVASFSPEGHVWALNHFRNVLGFAVI